MKRVFEIKGFRNMGFKDRKPEATELLLNDCAVKGKMGGLLTVIGTNGAGKTNVLDGLTTYASGKLAERDVTNLFYQDECQNPSLKMEFKDGEISYSRAKNLSDRIEINFPKMKPDFDIQKLREENLLADLDILCHLEDTYLIREDNYRPHYKTYISSAFNDLRNQVDGEIEDFLESLDEESKKKLAVAKKEFKEWIEKDSYSFVETANGISQKISRGKYESAGWSERKVGEYSEDEIAKLYDEANSSFMQNRKNAYRNYMKVCRELVKLPDKSKSFFTHRIERILEDYTVLSKLNDYEGNFKSYQNFMQNAFQSEFGVATIYQRYGSYKEDLYTELISVFLKKYGFHFESRIRTYTQSPITSEKLNTDINNISRNSFYVALFNAMGISFEQIKNAYRLYKQTQTRAFLSDFQKECDEKIKIIDAKFNKLFMFSSTPYEFSIEFERGGGIFFTIYRNGKVQVLDLQSTGFRYFFDMFFNLLNNTELKSGDIIKIDEPATNLHVKGQRELRVFLKEFAIQNDILIIIATHSPFMIDTDNLDEIRLVVSDGTVSHIENDFTAYDSGDPDSLRPIKEAFTAENHIIVNPKETVVFVAGMDAYCYLVAFKHLFEISGITFLPVKTFGDSEVEAQTVSNALGKIRSDSFILAEPGEAMERMKGIVSDKTVLSLSDIDSRFTTFAALFADGDLPSSASVFKNHITRGSVTVGDNTKANFRKVFDKLLHEAE